MLPDHAVQKIANAAARGLGSDLILRDASDTWETCSRPGAPEESGTGAGIEGWCTPAETPECGARTRTRARSGFPKP